MLGTYLYKGYQKENAQKRAPDNWSKVKTTNKNKDTPNPCKTRLIKKQNQNQRVHLAVSSSETRT